MAAIAGNNVLAVPLEDAVGKTKLVNEEWVKFMEIFKK